MVLIELGSYARGTIAYEQMDKRMEIASKFRNAVAAFIIEDRQEDIYERFAPLMSKINELGISVSIGDAVLAFGNTVAEQMQTMSEIEGEHSMSVKLMEAGAKRAYDVSKELRCAEIPATQKGYTQLERRLQSMGLVEQNQEKQEGFTFLRRKRNFTVLQEQTFEVKGIDDARIFHANTGSAPDGYAIDESKGHVREEYPIEAMRREQEKKKLDEDRRRQEEERKRQEVERAEMSTQAPKKPQRMILGVRDSSDRDDR